MKRMRCVLLAISLVSGAAVAQGNGGVINGDIHLTSARSMSPVQTAAQQGLVRFATQFVQRDGQLPAGFPLALGNASALAGLRLGLGFQVYDISGSALAGRAKLEDMAIANGTWRFEVLSGNTPVGLVTVANTAQGWQVVSMGGAGLAKDIHQLVAKYGQNSNVQLRYVRVPQATADFIQINNGTASALFAPLQAARESLKPQVQATPLAGLLDAPSLRMQLRQVISRNASN